MLVAAQAQSVPRMFLARTVPALQRDLDRSPFASETRSRRTTVIPIPNANVGSRRYPPLSGGHGGWQLLQKPVFRAQCCGSAPRKAPRLSANDRSRDLRTDALDPKETVAVFSACDRSTLELDIRRRRQASQGTRERSLAGGNHRHGQCAGRATASEGRVFTLPTLKRHTPSRFRCRKAVGWIRTSPCKGMSQGVGRSVSR